MQEITIKKPLFPMLWYAFIGKCPNCGQGKLFKGYLKQVEACACCGQSYGHIRADDAPAWLTIFLVGHILAPFAVHFVPNSDWPDWQLMMFWPGMALILALLLLPRSKGIFIALIWRSKCEGSQNDNQTI